MFVIPQAAIAAPKLVLSDVFMFRVTRGPTGGLVTSACRLLSDVEPGQKPEPAQPCNADVTGIPQGTAVVSVPNDPSETIRFSFVVPKNGDISGPATEFEQIPGAVTTYPALYRGTVRQIAPGVFAFSIRVYEPFGSP